jgi:hypothetical protein
LRPRDIALYKVCDDLSGGLIFVMILFSPWAFGTTQHWAVWVMNGLGYLAGALFLVKWRIRSAKRYFTPLWGGAGTPGSRRVNRILGGLTLLILSYTLVSALNARSTYIPAELSFREREFIAWLPHSFDASRTWFAFWMNLGLAGAFWGIWDWLRGKTTREAGLGGEAGATSRRPFPGRLRRVLWLLALNGVALAIEGILQRLEGSGELLFMVKPRVNPGADTQFGPWAYRANAAQFFNLLWPVCLGFWWMYQRRMHGAWHHWLLVCAAIMAACPVISTSRGGALITAGLVVLSVAILGVWHAAERWLHRTETGQGTLVGLACFFMVVIVLGVTLGWRALEPRMQAINEGFDLREEMYANARPMAQDYPVFGTGPGTFEYVFQLYRISTDTYWPAQLHNDWLETRITYGLAGLALILSALGTVLARWFASGGFYGGRRFVTLCWLSLAGCLMHARFDFPFQIHSIVFLFLLICAILFNLSRRP